MRWKYYPRLPRNFSSTGTTDALQAALPTRPRREQQIQASSFLRPGRAAARAAEKAAASESDLDRPAVPPTEPFSAPPPAFDKSVSFGDGELNPFAKADWKNWHLHRGTRLCHLCPLVIRRGSSKKLGVGDEHSLKATCLSTASTGKNLPAAAHNYSPPPVAGDAVPRSRRTSGGPRLRRAEHDRVRSCGPPPRLPHAARRLVQAGPEARRCTEGCGNFTLS